MRIIENPSERAGPAPNNRGKVGPAALERFLELGSCGPNLLLPLTARSQGSHHEPPDKSGHASTDHCPEFSTGGTTCLPASPFQTFLTALPLSFVSRQPPIIVPPRTLLWDSNERQSHFCQKLSGLVVPEMADRLAELLYIRNCELELL